eukprot:6427452-Pyramimonas_sp.AAC.1
MSIEEHIRVMNERKCLAANALVKASAGEQQQVEDNLYSIAQAYQARQPADKKDDDLADPICAEMLFWQSVKDNGFACPTSGKVHAIAGRWERAKKSNPQLKA